MAYSYQSEKVKIFTENGVEMFIRIRDRVWNLVKESGAVTMGAAISGESGDFWTMMACVDRMVETGELVEVQNTYCSLGQHRVFVPKEKG